MQKGEKITSLLLYNQTVLKFKKLNDSYFTAPSKKYHNQS